MTEQPISLQLSEVLEEVYQKLRAEATVVRDFQDASVEWASYSDWGRTREVDFYFNGFIAETSPQTGILVASGELGGKEWLLDFEKALILAKITLEEKPEFKSEFFERIWHSNHIESWDEVSEDNLRRALMDFRRNGEPAKPGLFIWKERLIFEGTEVTEHLVSPPQYSDRVSQGTGAFNGILFVSDYPGQRYQSPMGGMVPAIEEGAHYSPQVVDYLTSRLQDKTGINQQQLI